MKGTRSKFQGFDQVVEEDGIEGREKGKGVR